MNEEKFEVHSAELPAYDHQILTRINRWVIEQPATEIARMQNNHKRFILYYYFAVNFFSARDRIKLPECVVAAVRHKYPQQQHDRDYVGHKEIE